MFQGDAQLHGVENQLLSEDVPVASPEPSSRYARPWPSASIVIVNYNSRADLEGCLSSVTADAPAAHDALEIILVDNASTDGSADYVERAFPQVRVVRSSTNLGFGGANNLGARLSGGH
jgi:GT2 family glycosyltransferase